MAIGLFIYPAAGSTESSEPRIAMSQTDQKPPEQHYHLSSYRLTDVDEAFRHLSNPAVTKYLRTVPTPFTRRDALNYYYYLQQELQTNPRGAKLNFTIRENTTDKAVGGIRLALDGETWELGYWLGEEHWGQGIMTWACKAALRIAKGEGIKKIYAAPRQENGASRRVLEKNGFRHVRDEQHYYPADNKMYDVWIFELDLANGGD